MFSPLITSYSSSTACFESFKRQKLHTTTKKQVNQLKRIFFKIVKTKISWIFTPLLTNRLQWNPKNSKSRNLLNILTHLRFYLYWMVSVLPRISIYPIRYSKHFGIVLRDLIMTGNIDSFMFHYFSSSLVRSIYSYTFYLSAKFPRPEFDNPFKSPSPRESFEFYVLRQILVCT